MTPGGKHFLPGTDLDNEHTAYHRAQRAANAANIAYEAARKAYPSRPAKERISANARGSSLGVGNRTVEERMSCFHIHILEFANEMSQTESFADMQLTLIGVKESEFFQRA